jgi:hypothetical protein
MYQPCTTILLQWTEELIPPTSMNLVNLDHIETPRKLIMDISCTKSMFNQYGYSNVHWSLYQHLGLTLLVTMN